MLEHHPVRSVQLVLGKSAVEYLHLAMMSIPNGRILSSTADRLIAAGLLSLLGVFIFQGSGQTIIVLQR